MAETPAEAPQSVADAAPIPEVGSDADRPSATATEAAEEPSGADSPDDSDTDVEPSGKGKAAREAAKYRTQLRESQAQLADVTAKLDALRTEIVRDLAEKSGLVNGKELTVPVGELVDAETGLVDAAKVNDAVAALIAEKPYLKRAGTESLPPTLPIPGNGADPLASRGGKTWADFLRS